MAWTDYIIYIGIGCLFIISIISSLLFYKLGRKKQKPQIMPYDYISVKPKVKEKKFKVDDRIYQEKTKDINPLKKQSFMKRLKNKFKERFFPEKSVLINMELANGFHKTFMVIDKEDGFKYRSKKYIFDNESKYYNMDAKMWCYDYHEDITLPYKRKMPVGKIKTMMEQSGISEVEYMLNPSTLKRFTVAKIAEGIMKGQQIEEFFKRFQLMLIITMVAVIIHLLIFMIKSGMLQSIKMPF